MTQGRKIILIFHVRRDYIFQAMPSARSPGQGRALYASTWPARDEKAKKIRAALFTHRE